MEGESSAVELLLSQLSRLCCYVSHKHLGVRLQASVKVLPGQFEEEPKGVFSGLRAMPTHTASAWR